MKPTQHSRENMGQILTLTPKLRNPFYIVAPPYVRTSAGIRGLYLLCHHLNMIGEAAYIYPFPYWTDEKSVPGLLAPRVTRRIVDFYNTKGLSPIVIFSDTADSNFMDAEIVVRYLGNYPGKLKEYKVLAKSGDELVFSHSSRIASFTKYPKNVLFIPACDAELFSPPKKEIKRSGTCYYAEKYMKVHGGVIFGIPKDCFKITRDEPNELSAIQLSELFKSSEILYCFEDSAVANEAAMCGCPVVLVPNEHFTYPLGIEEVGWDGYAWGLEQAELDRAQRTVSNAHKNYVQLIEGFDAALSVFVCRALEFSESKKQIRPLRAPEEFAVFSSNRAKLNRIHTILESTPIIGRHVRKRNIKKNKYRLDDMKINDIYEQHYGLKLAFEMLNKRYDELLNKNKDLLDYYNSSKIKEESKE